MKIFEQAALTKNSTSAFIVLLVIVVITILSATILRGLVVNTLQTLKENKVKKDKLEILTKKLAYLHDLDPNQLEKRVKDLEQVFPSRKPALETLNSLNLLAVEDGVFLGGITLNPGKLEGIKASVESPENFKLTISVSGEMDKVVKYIKDLQTITPLNKIKELSVAIKKDAKGILIVDLGLEVYFQPLPKTLLPVDAPIAYLTLEEEQILDVLKDFKAYPLTSLPNVTTGKENPFKKTL